MFWIPDQVRNDETENIALGEIPNGQQAVCKRDCAPGLIGPPRRRVTRQRLPVRSKVPLIFRPLRQRFPRRDIFALEPRDHVLDAIDRIDRADTLTAAPDVFPRFFIGIAA